MKPVFLLIFGLNFLLPIKSSAQRIKTLKIEPRAWDANKKGIFNFVAHSQSKIEHLDSPIVLKNGDNITRYVFKKYFFITPKIPDENYISILVGTNADYVPLLVIDRNFNNSFSDDSVYKFSFSQKFSNEQEFYNSLPLISIDSLNINHFRENKAFQFKLAPYIQGTKYLDDKEVIKSAEQYALSFYVTNYLSSDFVINNEDFNLEIIPHPLSFPIYNQPNLSQNSSRWFFIINKINKMGRDQIIDRGPYQRILDHLNDTSKAIKILNKYLLINSISLDSNFIKVNIIDSVDYAKSKYLSINRLEKFENIQAYSVNNKSWLNYDFSKNKLTLVEFSGSWCAPCAEILPDLKNLYKKYADKMEFVSIMDEKSKSDAEKYFANHSIPWMVFYENIDSSETLKTSMNIHVFPTFFLVNQNGEIIYKHSTTENMNEMERKIVEQL